MRGDYAVAALAFLAVTVGLALWIVWNLFRGGD